MKQQYLMQFFEYAHLPERLQAVSRPFGELAKQLSDTLPENPEKTTALRKLLEALLEAKDCAVRSPALQERVMPGVDRECEGPGATHHHACACREQRFQRMEEKLMAVEGALEQIALGSQDTMSQRIANGALVKLREKRRHDRKQ